MNPAFTGRISKLQKRFLDILSGSVKLEPRGAALFLEGLSVQEDPVACLNAIVNSAYGLPSVQFAMRVDLSVPFMNGPGSTVLEYLLRACDVGGDALDNVLFHVVEPPIFWDAFVRAFQQDALSQAAQLVFAKLLSRLLTLQDRDTTPYQGVATQSSVQHTLISSPVHEIREIGHLIKHVLSGPDFVAASRVLDEPGGRHDNDFSNYRHIAILPTADEILCKKPPFLRAAFHSDEVNTLATPVEDYLDNTFRLLREDMLFDIREEVKVALQKKRKRSHLIDNLSVVGVHTAINDRCSRWGVELSCGEDLKQLESIVDQGAREAFLTHDSLGQKIMKHQSLVCLASGRDIIGFGIVDRVVELLACKPPVVVIQLHGAASIRRTLVALCTSTENIRLIQINAAMFSFEPVLTVLQRMKSVPLEREILLWSPETPVMTPQKRAALFHIADKVASNFSLNLGSLMDFPTSVCLDESQAKSLIAGLTKRVSLIQGPPGTGKSFIGTILAKAIHDKTCETMLIVCYTNHALDQFLGDLLDFDVPAESIVRLGGRPSQATEDLSLRKQPRGRFQYDWDMINELKSNASSYEHRLQDRFHELLDDDDTHLMEYLEVEHHEFFDAFRVPPVAEDGMTLVGENGRAINERYLFSRWGRGLDAGVLSGEPHVQASARIWGMDHSARQQLLATWQHDRIAKITESISQAGTRYNEAHDAIRREFGQSTVSVLRNKRVIACTTTGAAIYADAIKAVGPKFLIVEEAGEILESHILTALSKTIDQMILIGDHKQLRPKINNYELTVERGEGFDLNRSLFERLVLKGYPHETLSTQHRMRPEISALVRELTYPELVDAPSTYQRPAIRGVQSNVIFVDHSHPEDDTALIGDRADGGTKSSKQNTYEVQMVLKIVRYLAQQGYKSEDIVILTPYLGQLYLLHDALKHDNDPILNDLDSMDLARAGISSSATPGRKAKKGSIRLATIDNYQGEESNIVVASLTRSNAPNAIGFMDSPQRLNVLLSRARNGLILIGNSQTFLRSKKGGALWKRFFHLIDNGPYFYQGFPARCEKHPGRTVLLKVAEDFDAHCPDGGCTEPCGFTLACGHTCPFKCHPPRPSTPGLAMVDLHDTSQCEYIVHAECPAGRHGLYWQCRFGPPSVCSSCDEAAKRLEEIALQALERQKQREEADVEYRRRMAELEAELQAQEKVPPTAEECQLEVQRDEEELARREESRKRQEEECRRQEENKRQEEEEKKREEKKARREAEKERKKKEKQERKEEKERKRKEKKAKKDEKAKLVGKDQGEQTERTRQEPCKEKEADKDEEHNGKKQEQISLLQEATRKRVEQHHDGSPAESPEYETQSVRTVLLDHTNDLDSHRPEAEIWLPMLDPHHASQCRYIIRLKCPAGRHSIEWQCGNGPPSLCSACEATAKQLEEVGQQALERQQQRKMDHRCQVAQQVKSLVGERTARVEDERRLQEARRQEELVKQEECRKKQEEENKRREKRERKAEKKARQKEEKRKQQETKMKKQEEENKRREKGERKAEKKARQKEEKRKQQETKIAKDNEIKAPRKSYPWQGVYEGGLGGVSDCGEVRMTEGMYRMCGRK